ncbi:hypothetical protein Q7P37_003173 [Cladosporium fusiforme]
MRYSAFILVVSPLLARAFNVVISNDDGWAEQNVRTFYNTLTSAGFSTVLSSPAENQSGTGSSDSPASKVGNGGCQFGSCPAGSPATGFNVSNPRLNYVNSYPVTSMRYGIQTLSPRFFDGEPDIAVTGPNVGSNLGLAVLFSGTVGAATEAVEEGIPGIAFSGASGSPTAWNARTPAYSTVYAQLATEFTSAVVTSGPKPYLPADVYLNVNFPSSSSSACSSTSDFKFVLSRIYTALPLLTPKDVATCGNGGRLPTENSVVGKSGCFVSVSVGKSGSKGDASAAEQQVVMDRLRGILSCLP